MNSTQKREALANSFQQFLQFWQGKADDETIFADNIVLHSFQYGEQHGKTAIGDTFKQDRQNHRLQIDAANVYLAGQGDKGAVSAYLYGQAQNEQESLTFHGFIVLQFEFEAEHWHIKEIRLLHGTDGADTLPHWQDSRHYRRLWQPEDATSVIISELDNPWALFPNNEYAPESVAEQVQDVYSKYAWGIDFADFALLSDVFSENVRSDLTPMGKQQGKRNVYGQLRAFRLASRYLFHATKPLDIKVENENGVKAVLGRIIPEQTTADGKALYGAYYDTHLIKEADGNWRYDVFEYHPGWITVA